MRFCGVTMLIDCSTIDCSPDPPLEQAYLSYKFGLQTTPLPRDGWESTSDYATFQQNTLSWERTKWIPVTAGN